ncbi:MAG: hypothetical protein VYD05_14780, partial [Planctomycetota bacterium]|nr:hypothetical protein [Planctomycetota bacterium]
MADHRHQDAPELALQLFRRMPKDGRADIFRAIVAGLLAGDEADTSGAVWQASAAADRPFERGLAARWRDALAQPGFFAALQKDACKAKPAAIRAIAARALELAPEAQHEAARSALAGLLRDKDPSVVRAACVAAEPLQARSVLGDALASGTDAHQAARVDTLLALPHVDDEVY